jgi:hypothetical protein
MRNMRKLHPFVWIASLCIFAPACTQQSTTQIPVEVGDEALGQALIETGFPCDRIVNADRLGEAAGIWRIACSNARAYLASLHEGGEICIEPVLYADGLVSAPIITPETRCTSLT